MIVLSIIDFLCSHCTQADVEFLPLMASDKISIHGG